MRKYGRRRCERWILHFDLSEVTRSKRRRLRTRRCVRQTPRKRAEQWPRLRQPLSFGKTVDWSGPGAIESRGVSPRPALTDADQDGHRRWGGCRIAKCGRYGWSEGKRLDHR